MFTTKYLSEGGNIAGGFY